MTWTNQADADFSHAMVYLNGVFKTNISNPYYNAINLAPDTTYEVGTLAVDTNGNANTTTMGKPDRYDFCICS